MSDKILGYEKLFKACRGKVSITSKGLELRDKNENVYNKAITIITGIIELGKQIDDDTIFVFMTRYDSDFRGDDKTPESKSTQYRILKGMSLANAELVNAGYCVQDVCLKILILPNSKIDDFEDCKVDKK